VQRKVYIQEEFRALHKAQALSDSEKDDVAMKKSHGKYDEELRRLEDQLWDLSRRCQKLEADLPSGCVERGFRTYREDPNWYFCAWLRQDCAGRDCGRCEKFRAETTAATASITTITLHKWDRGHCTSACSCCIRSRGRDGRDAKKQTGMEYLPFNISAYKSFYSTRVYRAYFFWGMQRFG
ncbi:uncharacterized protein EURHEDRAFT_451694, partial [Aspergillus ruber CBS 135680]